MTTHSLLRRLPGSSALLLLVVVTTAAAVNGAASLFYEGWGQPVLRLLPYLAPAAVLMAIGLVAIRRPGTGAILLLGGGLAGGAWWFVGRMAAEIAPTGVLLMTLAVMLVPVVMISALLFVDAWLSRRAVAGPTTPAQRPGRTWRSAALVVIPMGGLALVSYQQVPALLARHDDGQRGARVIEGSDGVKLAWAPMGPGWNARASAGGHLSWAELSGAGPASAGRCAYLDEEGATLLDRPAGIWRMPSTGEIIQALSRGGVSAGCRWDGRSPHATCRVPPDKETPLWAPDEAPIYYWSDREVAPGRALAVNYTGGVSELSAAAGNIGVGFRCVKPAPATRTGDGVTPAPPNAKEPS